MPSIDPELTELAQMDAMLLFRSGQDTSKWTDEEFALRWNQLKWLIKQEEKRNGGK